MEGTQKYYTADEKLEFTFVADAVECLRDELIHAFHERGVLFLDTLDSVVLNHQIGTQTSLRSTQSRHIEWTNSRNDLCSLGFHSTKLQLDLHVQALQPAPWREKKNAASMAYVISLSNVHLTLLWSSVLTLGRRWSQSFFGVSSCRSQR